MSETLVRVENVSKKFCRDLKRSLWYGMQDLGGELLVRTHGGGGQLREDEFWAVKDVSFELKRGQCLGLIGGNGAGKTTLLRMLNGLIKPDRGSIEMRGRVGAMLALGAGFNPILTGRENIYVNASVLGLNKRDIDHKIDEIINFAEIGTFIDSPVQNYSAGMTIRLGFSVATSFQQDILLLDEVLAVGDAAFRGKCYRKISECLKKSAVIFVSHNMEQIARISTVGLLLDSGKSECLGTISEVVQRYNTLLKVKQDTDTESFFKIFAPISFAELKSSQKIINQGSDYELVLRITSSSYISRCWARLVLFNSEDFYSADLDLRYCELEVMPGRAKIILCIKDLRLRSGIYRVGVNLFTDKGEILLWSYKQIKFELKNQSHIGNSEYQPNGNARIIYES